MFPKSDRNTFFIAVEFFKGWQQVCSKAILHHDSVSVSNQLLWAALFIPGQQKHLISDPIPPDFWNYPVKDVTAAVFSQRCEWLFYFNYCFKVSSTACSVWWNASVTLDVSFSACCHGDCRLLSRMAGMKEQQFTEEKPLLPEQRGVDSDMVSRPVYLPCVLFVAINLPVL